MNNSKFANFYSIIVFYFFIFLCSYFLGNVFSHVCLSVCLYACLSVFLSVKAITFELLDIETLFLTS